MATPSEIAEARYIKYSTELAGLTVKQIDGMKDPKGILGFNAWNRVRRERKDEELIAERRAKLLTFFPSATIAQLDALNIKGESDDGDGLVIKLKSVEPIEVIK